MAAAACTFEWVTASAVGFVDWQPHPTASSPAFFDRDDEVCFRQWLHGPLGTETGSGEGSSH